MTADPFTFHLHAGWWLGALVVTGAYVLAGRRPAWRPTRRQALTFAAGEAVVLGAMTWPLGDLAAHWLLLALVVQRLLLMLVAAPLLLLGLPAGLLASLTRPAPVDAVVQWCTRPAVAVAVVTVASVGTLTTAAVAAQAGSGPGRVLLALALLATGAVLWAPVLGHLPGVRRAGPLGCAAYLVVQSILPSFLSVVWILSRHPLYAAYARAPAQLGMAPLTDQVIAGFVAKLTTILVLWFVALTLIHRSERAADGGGDPEPVTMSDVEREFERADRRRGRRSPLLPQALAPWERPAPWGGGGWPPPTVEPPSPPPGG